MSNQRDTENRNGSKAQSDSLTALVLDELETGDGVEVAGGGAWCRPWLFLPLPSFFSLFPFPWGGGCHHGGGCFDSDTLIRMADGRSLSGGAGAPGRGSPVSGPCGGQVRRG
jgi:hypothetical protein